MTFDSAKSASSAHLAPVPAAPAAPSAEGKSADDADRSLNPGRAGEYNFLTRWPVTIPPASSVVPILRENVLDNGLQTCDG
jgi:hypothetical protein